MYQVVLISLVGIMSLASLIASGIALAWIWNIKSSFSGLAGLGQDRGLVGPELDELTQELEKINKDADNKFEDEFSSVLNRRAL